MTGPEDLSLFSIFDDASAQSSTPDAPVGAAANTFAKLMQRDDRAAQWADVPVGVVQPKGPTETPLPPPFDLGKGMIPIRGEASAESLLQQVNETLAKAQEASQLCIQHPQLPLSGTYKKLLGVRLKKASEALTKTNQLLGVNTVPLTTAVPAEVENAPIGPFFKYMTQGLGLLSAAKNSLESLPSDGSFRPLQFFQMQILLSQAQQMFEWTSVTLGLMIQGVKTIMQVQL